MTTNPNRLKKITLILPYSGAHVGILSSCFFLFFCFFYVLIRLPPWKEINYHNSSKHNFVPNSTISLIQDIYVMLAVMKLAISVMD